MVRSLACRQAQSDTHSFPGGSNTYVAGHTNDDSTLKSGPTPPRFSYLPLPTIGHAHADGMIRRLLIAEPFGGDRSHARWAQRRLHGRALLDNSGNERGTLGGQWRRGSPDMIDRYTGKAKAWASVTPVILPGYDDVKAIRPDCQRPTKAERLLLKCVHQGGCRWGMSRT